MTTSTQVPTSVGELAERYGQAWNDHDLEAILALQTDDSVFVLHGGGGERASNGLQACRETYDFLLRAWPDQHFDVQRLEVREGFYVCESILTGTLALPWPMGDETFQPDGRQVRFDIVDIMVCEGNLVRHKSSWIDGFAIRQQLAR